MPLKTPKTCLQAWEAEKYKNPALTTEQMAMTLAMPHKIFLAKLTEARYMRDRRSPPVQVGAVTTFEMDASKDGWQQWILLQSDNHHDAVTSDRVLEEEHLEKAVQRNAIVMMFGDILDAMQGRFDPRRSMEELRPEYRRNDYYGYVVRDCATWYGRYAGQIGIMADGNHEAAVVKNASIDLLTLLADAINAQGGNIIRGGYGGWVHLVFDLGTGERVVRKIKYFHGSGGEAPVTRGAIQTNRQAVYLPDADFVVNGHSHNHYYIAICRERLKDSGEHAMDLQHHIRIPGYQRSYGNGTGGWEVSRGGVPKPVGAMWILFERVKGKIEASVMSDVRAPDVVESDHRVYTGRVYAQDGDGA